jgi:hypothetical protein
VTEVLASVADTVPATVRDAVLARAVRLSRDEGGSLAYRHELVRRALEDSLSQPPQQRLHAKVFAVLISQPNMSAARMAHHA